MPNKQYTIISVSCPTDSEDFKQYKIRTTIYTQTHNVQPYHVQSL